MERSVAIGSGSPGRSRSIVPDIVLAVLGVAIIAALVPPMSLSLFFAACLLFVWLRSASAGSVRIAVQVAGVVTIVLLLLYFKSSDLLFNDVVKRWIARIDPGTPAWYSAGLFAALGASYCFLRFVYALLDPSVTPWQFVRYYFFFPTFFSGPVMTPADFLSQQPSVARGNLVEGAARVMYGGVKFGLSSALQLAVPLTHITQFHLALKTQPVWSLWLGLFLCGVWLYLNFSAFTDIAIGIGRMLGIRVPENFDNPFSATDITDFWRRWHITLGDWLRVTVFNPLARGLAQKFSPRSPVLAVVPALVTMLVCGLWHQTTWAYLAWGVMHGVALAAHQLWRRFAPPLLGDALPGSRWYLAASWIVTHVYVSLAWALFFPLAQPGWPSTLGRQLLYLKRLLLIS
jgi:alginate O-acetyltransferase complex protein AlgI